MTGESIRGKFPIFTTYPDLAYLDNAATTQKPASVLEAISHYYQAENANIHRGIYRLAAKATDRYEQTRNQVMRFLKAPERESIIFTKGTTEGINIVAQSFLAARLHPGDEVLISAMEHHANLVPWQMICAQKGAHLRIIPLTELGELDMDSIEELLTDRTRMVALTHISNTLGTINPIESIIEKAHAKDIPVLIDAAQSVAHYELNVQSLDCDFLVFSGHKMYGPTGVGVLYGKRAWLEEMSPYQYGGDMIRLVQFEKTTFAPLPNKLEAGTPNIAGIAALGAAISFLNSQDLSLIQQHIQELGSYTRKLLAEIPDLRLIGESPHATGIVSFYLADIHPHDIATFLDHSDIAVRAGHHCTQPLMNLYGISGTARASFAVYNTREEVDRLVASLLEMKAFFA